MLYIWMYGQVYGATVISGVKSPFEGISCRSQFYYHDHHYVPVRQVKQWDFIIVVVITYCCY